MRHAILYGTIMQRMRFCVLSYWILFAVLLSSAMGVAQTEKLAFEKGNTAYNDGDYEKAIAFYEEVLAQGSHSAALYYNMGNAYYHLNQVGESIYHFEKAKQLKPRDLDIQFNSAFAQNMTIDSIEALPQSQFAQLRNAVFDLLSVDSWAKLGLIGIWLFSILFGMYLFSRKKSLKLIFLASSLLLFLISLGTFSITFLDHQQKSSLEYGIIFSTKVDTWSEPNERSEMLFALHEGTKVLLLDKLQEWQKIRIANGSEGWLRNAEIRSLKQPTSLK